MEKHICIKEPKFAEIEGEINTNNQITLLKMSEIEKDIKNLNNTIDKFIKRCDVTYITKNEFQNEKEKIKKIESNISRIARLVISFVVVATLNLLYKGI